MNTSLSVWDLRLPALLIVGLSWNAAVAEEKTAAIPPTHIGTGVQDERGIVTYEVRSPWQSRTTEIRVLPPRPFDPKRSYPVVYVLPVEAGRESRYGDGLVEILNHRLHERHHVLFVAPTFAELPWYADHPTREDCRQESYFVRTVVPFIEKTWSCRIDRNGRLLLGFSKSGWGAWSLLLRHPETFGRAAAWDAPLMMDRSGLYGSGPIFGTQENFESYRLTNLLTGSPAMIDESPRLIHTAYGNFREHHRQMSELLTREGIPFRDLDGPQREHDWHSGWVAETLELLLTEDSPPPE